MDGDAILVGGWSMKSGEAHLFDAASGSLIQSFQYPKPLLDGRFGYAVAVKAGRVLIGAPGEDSCSIAGGAAYLFETTTGILLDVYSNPDGRTLGNFGCSVALDGPYALVGAPSRNHLFEAATGNLVRSFDNPPFYNSSWELREVSVALDKDLVVIGNPDYDLVDLGDPSGGTLFDVGQAYVYNLSTGQRRWILDKPLPQIADHFGRAVAVVGDAILIGAPGSDLGSADSGSAYVFHALTGDLIQTLDNPSPANGSAFGRSVALDGTHALVAAASGDLSMPGGGKVHLFDSPTGNLLHTFENPAGAPDDGFGFAVALEGANAVIGAFGDDATGLDAGRAYLFSFHWSLCPDAALSDEANRVADWTFYQ
jgi:hypothetical protein